MPVSVLRCEHCGHCTLDPEHVCTKPPRTTERAVELLRDGTRVAIRLRILPRGGAR